MSRRRLVRPVSACIALTLALLAGCDDSQQRVEHNTERQEVAREAALNVCQDDSQCQPTGCRQTLCRALPDETFCPHRLVLVAAPGHDPATFIEPVERALLAALDDRERDSLTVTPIADALVASFHAPRAQRPRLEALFAGQSAGIFRPHPDSNAVADAALAAAAGDTSLSVHRAAGGPRLLESRIETGDIASLADVRAAAERLQSALAGHLPGALDEDVRLAFEPLWSVDPPVLRAWVLQPTPAVDFGHLESLRHEARPAPSEHEPRALAVSVTLDAEARRALATLGREARGKAVVVALGPDVLAAPVLDGELDAGRFELVVERRGDDEALVAQLERLQAAPDLSTALRLDRERTRGAEAELPCFSTTPPLTDCGCVEGRCAWQPREGFAQCAATGELPEGHTATLD